ncbi:WLM-domain-containing protein [Echria macrotheca]|uniref:WLM-domain-containing protein n=1 Tax=Echria macrotheca TaxID=438768 RepID=A0AAJ0BAD4_9PEZI|nr:WLM-domain-containing protein [Echria macrotheca]
MDSPNPSDQDGTNHSDQDVPSSPVAEDTPVKIKEPYEEGDDVDYVVTIKFGPEKTSEKWGLYHGATLEDLVVQAYLKWPAYDWTLSKVIVEKRVPDFKSLLKSTEDAKTELDLLKDNSLRLMAPKIDTQKSLEEARAGQLALFQAARKRALGKVHGISRRGNSRQLAHDAYTFQTIRPLSYLPNPERSTQYLERLKADPGIKAAMRKHKFSVGLLTEMDPSQFTEHHGDGGTTRILGRNRNFGEVIELRLRTDAYDGYRDYKTIRKTLCHELAHNVHGDHDRDFWDLCHQIEREVHAADWKKSGRTVGEEEYRFVVDDTHEDAGGWVGGEYTLGGGGQGDSAGLSRREILARAAESRWKRLDEAKQMEKKGPSGS